MAGNEQETIFFGYFHRFLTITRFLLLFQPLTSQLAHWKRWFGAWCFWHGRNIRNSWSFEFDHVSWLNTRCTTRRNCLWREIDATRKSGEITNFIMGRSGFYCADSIRWIYATWWVFFYWLKNEWFLKDCFKTKTNFNIQLKSSKMNSTKMDFCEFLGNLDFPLRWNFGIFFDFSMS